MEHSEGLTIGNPADFTVRIVNFTVNTKSVGEETRKRVRRVLDRPEFTMLQTKRHADLADLKIRGLPRG